MPTSTLLDLHLDAPHWGRRNGLFTRRRETPVVQTVHIVDDGGDWIGSDLVTALCGRTGRFDEDGDMETRGFHFVEPPDEEQATCRWCRESRELGPAGRRPT